MNLRTAASIAFRSFRRGRRKGRYNSHPLIGAILGVSLSLVPLIVVVNLSEGMIQGIVNRYIETDSYHLQVFSYGSKDREELEIERDALLTIDEVQHAWLERKGEGIAYSETDKTGIALRAVDPTIWKEDDSFNDYIKVLDGEFDLSDDKSIVLGEAIATKLQVKPGDQIKMLTGKVFPNGQYIPRFTPLTVKGIFTSGYQEMDRLWVFIPYSVGEKLITGKSQQSIIGVKIDEPYGEMIPIMQRISEVSVGPNWRAYSWNSLNRSQLSSYNTTRSMLLIIMVMLVLVACLNVYSSLNMLVLENRQPIGVMKCMGASPVGIKRIYILTGLFVGIGGAIFGCTIGILISRFINQIIAGANGLVREFLWLLTPFTGGGDDFSLLNSSYYLQEIPVTIQWDMIALVGFCAVILSWISSTLPASRAAKIRPLEVIRKF